MSDEVYMPGICQFEKCRIRGPRCQGGFCVECCKKKHGKYHLYPAQLGEFRVANVTLLDSQKVV